MVSDYYVLVQPPYYFEKAFDQKLSDATSLNKKKSGAYNSLPNISCGISFSKARLGLSDNVS